MISLVDRPLKVILLFIFLMTMSRSVCDIVEFAAFNRRISLRTSFTAFSATGFLFLLISLPTWIEIFSWFSNEPLLFDSFSSVWNDVAPSTLMVVPESSRMSKISESRDCRSVFAVWSGIRVPRMNWDNLSLTMRIFWVLRSITSAARVAPIPWLVSVVSSIKIFWGWGWFEAEVEVRLRWGWVEV